MASQQDNLQQIAKALDSYTRSLSGSPDLMEKANRRIERLTPLKFRRYIQRTCKARGIDMNLF